MRRLMMLVTVAVLMTAMLVATIVPALAIPGPPARSGSVGTPLPTVVCELPAAASPNIGWRNGTCWVFHP
jgi:hypothetical protein